MRERTAWYIPGPQLLLGDLALLIVGVIVFWQSAVNSGAVKAVLIVLGVVIVVDEDQLEVGAEPQLAAAEFAQGKQRCRYRPAVGPVAPETTR